MIKKNQKKRLDNKEVLLKRLAKRKLMSAEEILQYLPNRVALSRMVKNGDLFSVGPAIYSHNSVDPFVGSVVAASKYYPQCIISNLTALVIHELSDERIDRIDVDISRETSLRNKFMSVHRVPNNRLMGITKIKFHDFSVRIYDMERCLCEAYFIDTGGPIFFKALKRYIAQGNTDTEKIRKYDEILKTNVLSHIRQELADG